MFEIPIWGIDLGIGFITESTNKLINKSTTPQAINKLFPRLTGYTVAYAKPNEYHLHSGPRRLDLFY